MSSFSDVDRAQRRLLLLLFTKSEMGRHILLSLDIIILFIVNMLDVNRATLV